MKKRELDVSQARRVAQEQGAIRAERPKAIFKVEHPVHHRLDQRFCIALCARSLDQQLAAC